MAQQPFQSRFPLSAMAAGLLISAFLLVAAGFSAQPGLMAAMAVMFVGMVTAATVLVARELTRKDRERPEVSIPSLRAPEKTMRRSGNGATGQGRGPVAPLVPDEESLRRIQKAEAVERLREGIVHDLNNRLMVISANIDAVARQMKEQPVLQRKLLSALVASDQAATLIARSTAFARQHRTNVQNIDLGERIESVAALMSRSLLRDTVELRVMVADDLWPVAIDPDDLETAVVTLSAHVRDALEQGGSIRLEASNVQIQRGMLSDPLLEGDFVRLVIDSTDVLRKSSLLDDPSVDAFRLDDVDISSWITLDRGLHFLHLLGGATEVRSSGTGLVISVYLRRADLPVRLRTSSHDDDATPTEKVRAAIEILVVDDEFEVALAVQTMLEEFGYATQVATDAGQAFRALNARKPELVLMDVSMPGTMSGVMLAREVRLSFPDLPIVLFTGNPNVAEDQSEFPLLQKPIVSRDLHAAIQRELRFAGETKVVPLFPHQARRAP